MIYQGDTFQIKMHRYSDPERLNAARNAAIYLGKPDRDNIKRPLSIIRMGHVPEIFRGEMAEFEFIDVSKEVYDHLITYTTRNMRVAGGNRALTSDNYTLPSDKVKNNFALDGYVHGSMDNYKKLLDLGETPQVARSAMPIAAKLNPFVYQFNFVTLMHIFQQRLWLRGAQGNTIKVVQGMWSLVREIDPDLWDTVRDSTGEEMESWKEVRKRLKRNDPELYKMLLEEYGQIKSMWD